MILLSNKKAIGMWIAIVLLISPFLFPSPAYAGAVQGGGGGGCSGTTGSGTTYSCAVDRFWVGGTGTWDASDTTHWSATTGGAGGASVPDATTRATFDASSGGGTVTLGYSPSVCRIVMGAFTGTFDASTFSPTMSFGFSGTGTGVRTLNMGSGTWTITDSGGDVPWNIGVATNLTLNAQTSTVKMTVASTTVSSTFVGGGKTYNNVWFARGAVTQNSVVTGSNTFNDFKDTGTAAHNLIFDFTSTTTVSTFTVSGSSGNVITINGSSTSGCTYALVKTGGGTISSDYLNIQHSVATPASTWYAGTHSTNNQGVATAGSGWTFTAPPAGGATATPSRVMRLFEGFIIKIRSGQLIIRPG